MKVLRTADERFAALPDFPFAPNYQEVDGLRMHYVDEGPRDGEVVLLLHGEPTWSYLYRKMIPPLAAAGYRVLAPDLIGFGRSDKLAEKSAYSYQSHTDWVLAWMDALQLSDITLFCQDWGSLLGLRLAGLHSDRFSRICVGNGFLPTGEGKPPLAFFIWKYFALHSPVFPIGRIVNAGCLNTLSAEEIAAYDAPFPSRAYKAAVRKFPALVPVSAKDPAVPVNRQAWEGLGRWEKPFLCLFGRNDPILGHADKVLIPHVPGAKGQPHQRLRGGHFIQEDQGPELARLMIDWMPGAAAD